MFAFASLIFQFLGGPVAKSLVAAYQAHLTATTTETTVAADLAGKEIAAQTAEIQAQTQLKIAEIDHPFEPEKLAFYVWLTYFAKIMIWDKVLGLGSTDPVLGAAAVWSNLIVGFYFSKRTAENIFRIFKR